MNLSPRLPGTSDLPAASRFLVPVNSGDFAATGFFLRIGYGRVLSGCSNPFFERKKMADKGKALKKPTQSIKERRAEKRRKQTNEGEFVTRRKSN